MDIYIFIGLAIICFIISAILSMAETKFEELTIDQQNTYYTTTRFGRILSSGLLFISIFEYAPTNYQKWIYFIIALFGYMIMAVQLPKLAANKMEDTTVLNLFKPIHTLFTPFTFFLRLDTEEEEEVSEEEIREMITTQSEIEESQSELIENVFELDDTSIEEICTHRSEVDCLYLEDDVEEWKKDIFNIRHTYFPVFGEDEDDIIGVIDTRDYFRLPANASKEEIINQAMEKPLFVSENTKVDSLFREMKNKKKFFAIVLDEYGGVEGVVTLHDVIETILGDLVEEDEEDEPLDIRKIDDNKWIIYGSADLEEVQEKLNMKLDTDDNETFAGYILSHLGYIPEDHSRFELNVEALNITVKEVKNHKIGQTIVLVQKGETKSE
ncbi:MAG: hemolysin family protein [Bacillota bacterium]|nr:hemolysin family protein [Bacillota bacterium]